MSNTTNVSGQFPAMLPVNQEYLAAHSGAAVIGEKTYTPHVKQAVTWLRPYVPGEDLTGMSIEEGLTPVAGGYIGVNKDKPTDRWYVSPEYYAQNYRPA